MKSKIIIFTLLLLPQFLLAEKPIATNNDGWKHASTKANITVYTQTIPGSKIRAFKVVSTLNASAKDILGLMRDVEGTVDWSPDVVESSTVENFSDLKAIIYSALDVPWPVSNRDFVLSNELNLNKEKKYLILNIKSVESAKKPPRKSFIRAQMKGKIYLRPASEKKTEMVMFAHIDPKGKIPKWIVNIFQKSWPYRYFRSIEKNANIKKKGLKPKIAKMLQELTSLIKVSAVEPKPLSESVH